jgi:phage terminase Nu1 subunit (DNA packaging protein)
MKNTEELTYEQKEAQKLEFAKKIAELLKGKTIYESLVILAETRQYIEENNLVS